MFFSSSASGAHTANSPVFPIAAISAKASVIVGSLASVAELTAAGRPAILVPLPIATDDHQTVNAREMARVGGARMIAQRDFTPATLAAQIEMIASDPQALANAAGRALSVGRPHATRDLANLVERIAGRLSPIAVGPAGVKAKDQRFSVGAPA